MFLIVLNYNIVLNPNIHNSGKINNINKIKLKPNQTFYGVEEFITL